ncbi:hypothetical protein CBR_g36785 [Chara braunii]|uniref:Uncharacterized protein n=1 Tax=Chara braunii TaxID=69332 RepID=A0A388LLH3_CHABU|nr:hypothetical protein CBR_g36785 [Chara braunii]|eukprot:GBG83169.1 hypothetical protein CBR_g36785 [Chara braunii]
MQREDARGQFDDSEDEATPRPPFSPSRERDRSVLSIPGVRQQTATDPGVEGVLCGSDLEPTEGHGAEGEAVGGEGVQGTPQKRRGECQEELVGSSKKQKTKTPRTAGEKRKGRGVEEGHPGSKRLTSKHKQPESGPFSPRPAIDVDAGYFLKYKDGVRTRREFEISPAQIVDIREWEDLYNQRSLDPVLVETIREAMRSAFENKEQTYELPVFKLAPLGLQKPTPGTKAQRLKPEEQKDELAGEYYYYAVCGQQNAAAARSLLGSEVAKKYNFERWPARMVYFFDDDFEGYFLVSSQDNKKDLKAPSRQLKLSMKDIRWQWKHDGCPRVVMGNPSGKQDQVRAWRKFCTTTLHKAPQNSLWLLADQKEEEATKKQNAALRSYLPLAMAGENVWKLGVEFFEKWETGRLLSHDGAKWTVKEKKVKNGSVYGDMERNSTQFVGLLDFLGKKGEGVVFLGKPHARSVWELLKAGRHVVAMEGNSDLLQFTMQVVKSEVNSSGHNCEFMVVRPTRDKVWSKKTDMWFKLSERKRNKIYDFLFLQTRLRRDTDAEYIRRKDHMLALFDNYHFASRINAKTFIESLQSLYFMESEEQLKLASYASLISTDAEEAIGVEFVASAKEEESDTESIDLQYDPPPADHGRGSSSAGPSPSVAALVSPLAKAASGTTPMKLLERLRALAAPLPALRPGSVVPPDHPYWKDDNIHFLLEPQRHSPEQDRGHDMVWHPGVIQPAIRNGEWVMAVAIPGEGWVSFPRDIAARDGDAGKVSPERERRPQGLQQEAASAGSGDTETTKSAEIRTSSGGVCRPGIVVPLRGAACTGTEGRSSRFGTGTAEGDEFRGREVGEEMEEQKGAQEGKEEGEEEVEGEEAGETELIDLFEGREGAGSGEDEVEHSEDDARSGESSDEFGQLYGEHHEDDVDDDATTIEMETQVVSSLCAEPEDYAVWPLTSTVDLQHRFDEASVAISPSEKSRRISIDEVIDGILGDHNVSARPSATANVASFVAAALASSPPKSLVLQATLATEGEGECGGGQHVTSPKKSRFGGQVLDVLALSAPNSPSKERREKQTGKP